MQFVLASSPVLSQLQLVALIAPLRCLRLDPAGGPESFRKGFLQVCSISVEDPLRYPALEQREQRGCGILWSLCLEGIDDPSPFSAIRDQIGTFENAQLVGDAGLRHLEGVHELTYTKLSSEEQIQNPQASLIRKGLEKVHQRLHGCLPSVFCLICQYIDIYAYIILLGFFPMSILFLTETHICL